MLKLRAVLLNSKAAIDLASIMVGIIVIGLIGGVIAATVFAVIPWAQDNAAKQQLDSIHTAQNAAYGLSADPSRELPAGQERNSFTNSVGLDEGYGLLTQNNESYCTTAVGEKKDDYRAYSKSGSGQVWFATKNKQAQILAKGVPGLADCSSWVAENNGAGSVIPTNPGVPGDGETPEIPEEAGPVRTDYVDTRYRVNCPADRTTLRLPIKESVGELKVIRVSDNVEVFSGRGNTSAQQPTVGLAVNMQFVRNTEYEIIFTGTFKKLKNDLGDVNSNACYREMTSWSTDSGTVDASQAFWQMTNLSKVPASIPITVTSTVQMFGGASKFNQNLDTWDMENVERITGMFQGATAFKSSLAGWELNNVKDARYVFDKHTAVNTVDMSGWKVTGGKWTGFFAGTKDFPANASNWVVTDADLRDFFYYWSTAEDTHTYTPKVNLNGWTVKGSNFSPFFKSTSTGGAMEVKDVKMDGWKFTNNPTSFTGFANNSTFNSDINNWDVSNVTNMSNWLSGATHFNKPINNWDVSNVTDMRGMLSQSVRFNQPLADWGTKTGNVTNMTSMLNGSTAYAQNLSGWNVSSVTSYERFGLSTKMTAAQRPQFK